MDTSAHGTIWIPPSNQNQTLQIVQVDLKSTERIKNSIKRITEHIQSNKITKQLAYIKLQELLDITARHTDNLELQQICCHAISNIAMNVNLAVALLSLNADEYLLKCLNTYLYGDWKLCWLACSAIWNLARPETTRPYFNIDAVNMIFNVMKCHGNHAKVMNTCLGALSNLSLNDKLKAEVGNENRLFEILKSMDHFCHCGIVSSTGCGLIANLAVDDTIANNLVRCNALNVISKIGQNYIGGNISDTSRGFTKNLTASISNLSTSPGYKKQCVRYCIIEILYIIIDAIRDEEIISLCWNALTTLSLIQNQNEIHEPLVKEVTSFHVACKEGFIDEVKYLLKTHGGMLLRLFDFQRKYPIDYAHEYFRFEIIEFLISIGSPSIQQNLYETYQLQDALQNGLLRKQNTQRCFSKSISQICSLCEDTSHIVVQYCGGYDVTKTVNLQYIDIPAFVDFASVGLANRRKINNNDNSMKLDIPFYNRIASPGSEREINVITEYFKQDANKRQFLHLT